MKILTLVDERGRIWRNLAVIVEEPGTRGFSEAYYIKEAEQQLFKKFADYWWNARFPIYSHSFINEVGKTLEANGWSVVTLTSEQEIEQ